MCSKHAASEFARYTPVIPESSLTSASRTLGNIGLLAWILPIVGFPLTLIGLALGVASLRGAEPAKAVRACWLCGVGLLLSVGNAAAGIYLYTHDKFPTMRASGPTEVINTHCVPQQSAATTNQ